MIAPFEWKILKNVKINANQTNRLISTSSSYRTLINTVLYIIRKENNLARLHSAGI